MKTNQLIQIEKQIRRIQQELQELGEMRPGSLTKQYKVPEKKKGPYYQISYTHKMKSHTEYVPRSSVQEVRRQISRYKRFKALTERWVALSIRYCKLKRQLAKRDLPG